MKRKFLTLITLCFISISVIAQTEDSLSCKWTKQHYVDEFNEPTNDYYHYLIIEGVFSNSATTNSELLVKVNIDNNNKVEFFLYEYGSIPVKGDETFMIKVKASGEEYKFKPLYLSDRLSFGYFDKKSDEKLIKLLKSDVKLSIYMIEYSDYSTKTSYVFTIPQAHGFKNRDLKK